MAAKALDETSFSGGYRGWFLALMVAISTCSAIDRVAVITVGQAIKEDLRLTDFEFGLLSGFGFAVLYAVLGLPIARLADTRSRAKLVAAAVAIWSVVTVLSGLARSFGQMMVCRIVIGVGEAGVQPPTVSMISDLYPRSRRGFALGILALGVPIGTLFGAIGGGYLAQYLSWRTAFILLGVPGVILAAVAFLTLREPPRGMSDRKAAVNTSAPALKAVLRCLAAKPSFWHLVAAVAVINFATNSLGAFLPQYFSRAFNMGLGRTGIVYGLVGAVSTLVGYVFGGMVTDWVGRRDERWYVWLPGIGVLASAPLYVASFLIPNPIIATVFVLLGSTAMFLYYTPTQVLLQNMVEPQMRATAAFLFFFVGSLVGLGFGPALTGLLSDVLAAHSFHLGDYAQLCPPGAAAGRPAALESACRAASALGIRGALTAMGCLYFWAMAHYFLAARTVRQDIEPLPS